MADVAIDAMAASVPAGDGSFIWSVPDGWQQGRGAFGGLVLDALCRAAMAFEDDPSRAPRAMNGELIGPVLPGEAALQVRLLRRGGAVTTVDVSLTQDDEIRARASFVLGGPRKDPPEFADRPGRTPESLDWESAPVLRMEPGAAWPTFAQHFEFRLAGPPPFRGGHAPLAGGWIRPKVRPAAIGASEIVAYADVLWPAGFSLMTAPRPIATIAFQLQWLADPATLDPEEPLLCLARVGGGLEGYVAETRELFDPMGRLVAINQQTFVWI